MIAHLFESTLVLAAAILLSRMPRLAARTRYTVVFAGLLKFAIPSAIVPRLLAFAGLDLTRMPKGTIFIQALGTLASKPEPAIAVAYTPMTLMAIWLTVAAALLARALMRGRETLRRALADGRDADASELAALNRARSRTGLSRNVRLISSSSIGAPATAGILRPTIIIPAATTLTRDELETILTHECAHIARHDNALSLIEAIAGCALWFHPLVWIARRILDAAREEACDAVVIASSDSGTYINALHKVCEAAIGPRVAAVSCIVSNTIGERMEAIMTFGSRRFLDHRLLAASVIAALTMATIGVGVARAISRGDTTSSKYEVEVTATREASSDFFNFSLTVRDRKSGKLVASAKLRSAAEAWGTATSGTRSRTGEENETVIRMIGHADDTVEVETTVNHEPPIITKLIARRTDSRLKPAEGISITLKDADIHDVLRTLAQLTKTDIVVDDGISGQVTVDLADVPWTKALDIMLRQNNLRFERTDDTIYVHRQ